MIDTFAAYEVISVDLIVQEVIKNHHYAPSSVPGAGDAVINKTDAISSLTELTLNLGE